MPSPTTNTVQRITARRGSRKGPVVDTFDNGTTAQQVIAAFRAL